ncbi:MAG TPA: hypothetical protein VGK81_01800 [Anaerolineae bacterium]
MSRNGWIALITGLVVACICLVVTAGAFLVGSVFVRNGSSLSIPTPEVLVTSNPTNTPRPVQRTPLPTSSSSTTDTNVVVGNTLEQALSVTLPREDLESLAVRFKGVSPQQTVVTCTSEAKGYDVGATRSFILSDQDTNTEFTVTARLAYKTQYAYMWVETSPTKLNLDQNALQQAGDDFTNKILPTDRTFFGDEARPGVDCDPHLYILHATGVGSSVGGYFSSPDEFPKAVRPDSNVAEMFVVNAEQGYNGADPGSRDYMTTLAHELQHMISFNQVHAPALWLEEGAAQLAERLNGYADTVTTVFSYANAPDTQLNTWAESSAGENSAHYGGGYLFWSYLYDRYGADMAKQLARSKERSPDAFLKIMAAAGITNPDTGKGYTFEDLFADWVIANYMGQTKLSTNESGNRYNYAQTDVPPMKDYANLATSDYPYDVQDQVNQFGTHYIRLHGGNSPVTVNFIGSTTVPLIPTTDANGKFWWSNRADSSDSRLTREVDLTKVKSATLQYRAWYRVEQDFDYGYVSVSEDGGSTWKILRTSTCVTSSPNGSNLGCGYTGSSGNGNTPQWVDEQADLTPWAGKKVLLRFEVVTDAGVNREGLAIDDITIPEISFKDDGSTDTGWQSEGWVRADNVLPQFWKVQFILTHQDGSKSLERMALTNNAGSVTLKFGSDVTDAVLAVSATTPIITEPGSYELHIK